MGLFICYTDTPCLVDEHYIGGPCFKEDKWTAVLGDSKHKPETHLYGSLADKLGMFTGPRCSPAPLIDASFPIFIKIKIDEFNLFMCCLCAWKSGRHLRKQQQLTFTACWLCPWAPVPATLSGGDCDHPPVQLKEEAVHGLTFTKSPSADAALGACDPALVLSAPRLSPRSLCCLQGPFRHALSPRLGILEASSLLLITTCKGTRIPTASSFTELKMAGWPKFWEWFSSRLTLCDHLGILHSILVQRTGEESDLG